MPALTFDQLTSLLHLRAGDVMGDSDVIAPQAVARILANHLSAEGFRQFYAASDDITVVYRTGEGCPARVTVRDFRAEIGPRVAEILASAASAEHAGARRARATLQALKGRHRGAESWLRTAALHAREVLPDLTEQEEASIEQQKAAKKAAALPRRPPEGQAEAQAVRRQSRKEGDAADARHVMGAWLPTLPDGPHALPDVWAAFQHARQKAEKKLRAEKPGALTIGRTAFYRLAADLGEVTTGHARARFLKIPYQLRVSSLLRRRQYVAALQLQRAHLAER
jgi:hypothetical protein